YSICCHSRSTSNAVAQAALVGRRSRDKSRAISPSPSAPAVVAANRRPAEQISAREISRSPEARCDGPAPVEARARSLTASPPFPLALAVSLLSFLRLQPDLHQVADGLWFGGNWALLSPPTLN